MEQEGKKTIIKEISGCKVIMNFSVNSDARKIENIKGILSAAYDERIQKELAVLIKGKQ